MINFFPFIKTVQPGASEVYEKTRQELAKDFRFIGQRSKLPMYRFATYKSYLDTGCKKVWATYRSLRLKSSVVLSTDLTVTSRKSDENVLESTTGKAPELARLLARPNPHDSMEEMLELWVFHIGLTGNAYWVKDQPNLKGQPLYLYPLLPQNVSIVPDPTDKISHYIYKVNGEEVRYERDEIIHFRRPHPCNLYYGMGDIEPSEPLYEEFINRDTLEDSFIENGAMPSGILTYLGARGDSEGASMSDLDDEEWGKIKKMWHEQYGGRDNAGKTMLISGDWKYHRLGLTSVEMESIQKSQMNVKEIFANHGVPLSIAGIEKAANYATARQDEINFRRYEIVPLIDSFVGKLNAPGELIQNFSPDYKLGYELSGLIDVEQTWKDYEGLLKSGGMSLNEAREKMGLPRVDNPLFDEYFTGKDRIPLDMAGMEGDETDDAIKSIVTGQNGNGSLTTRSRLNGAN